MKRCVGRAAVVHMLDTAAVISATFIFLIQSLESFDKDYSQFLTFVLLSLLEFKIFPIVLCSQILKDECLLVREPTYSEEIRRLLEVTVKLPLYSG